MEFPALTIEYKPHIEYVFEDLNTDPSSLISSVPRVSEGIGVVKRNVIMISMTVLMSEFRRIAKDKK